LQRLWSPWRSQYVGSAGGDTGNCVFCDIRSSSSDEENFVLHRASHNLIVLNLYPYTSGHLLIVPYEHVAELSSTSKETSDELMDLTKRCESVLRETYNPEGLNIGMNLGKAAGAGIMDHVHLHILPRWNGDTNFMTAIGETRVLPEDLNTTYQKLRGHF
jgi:ATP adenylyltransferase